MLKVLIVDDSPTVIEAVRRELDAIPRVEITAVAHGSDEAIAHADLHAFDFAVVDLQLAQGTGYHVIRHLRTKAAPTCIVVLTNHAVPALKVAAFEAGADYFLDKSKDLSALRRIVLEVTSTVTGHA